MNYSKSFNPIVLNLDKSPNSLSERESFYTLNHETNVIVGKGIPIGANQPACEISLPAGENYSLGSGYHSPITNETYSWHFNSNGVHHIQRINGEGECDIIYVGDCLKLSADPKHAIEQWRAVLDVDYLCTKIPGGKLKRLVWCDGSETPIGCIDVESAIATNFFTTPFFERCADPCAMIQLCVPEPERCLVGDFVPFQSSDISLSNRLLDKGFKFMYRYVYYDGRASEWSDRSSLYFQDAKGCFDNTIGFSRCMKFRIPIGNPMVDVIEFAFSEDGGLTWFISERIEKYKKYNSSQQYWYERDLSETVSSSFSDEDCAFDYLFCNDKQRIPVSPLQISREFNPLPQSPQGLFRLKNSLAFYNYEKGVCPIDKNEADKFDIELNCNNETSCNVEYAKVTVRAIVHNEVFNQNSFVFRLGGGENSVDDLTDTAWFSTPSPAVAIYTGYGQNFTDKTRNFIPYIEGTNYWGTMEQWKASPGFNSRVKVGTLGGLATASVQLNRFADVFNGKFYYQEYIFKVPRGTKGFIRLASHHQTNGLSDNQNTSTQIIGVLNDLTQYRGNVDIHSFDGTLLEDKREIYFDTCNGDVDDNSAFVIADFYNTSGISDQSSAYSGYLTDGNNQPIEGAKIYRSSTFETTSDHNGFYAFYRLDGAHANITIDVRVERDCTHDWLNIANFSSISDKGQISNVDYNISTAEYKNGQYAIVKVPVKDCDNNPVPGVRVAISGSKYKITDSDGIAHFKLRNYFTRNRYAFAVVMDKGNCFTTDCDGNCNPCMPETYNTLLAPCFETIPEYTLTPLSSVNVENIDAAHRALKKGGRYQFGWVLEGDCGKLSAVNPIQRNGGYIDIPRLQETVSFNVCNFSYNANDITLPNWGNKIKIVRSVNLNPYKLQWVVDKVERTADSKIKLTIQSLNDYNKQFNFKTNTIYQYLLGDRVEFIRNGDGKIFDTATNGVLNYLTLNPFNDTVISGVTDDANYFNQLLIADDGKLDSLTIGAVVELQTPAVATTETTFFEICATIEVIDGKVSIPTGTFSTFDTYLVNRQIGSLPAQIFEHKTPSDFWGGDYLDDLGKVHFLNKYENVRRYERDISLNSPTQLNYFGDIEKQLDAREQGAIIAISLNDDKIGLAICENDNFLFEVSDQLVRVGSDNVIRAASADSVISNPEAKLKGKYGCLYQDIGSIFFGDGFARYCDSKNKADIIHNYSFAREAGTTQNQSGEVETTCSSYFQRRLTEKEFFNKSQTNFLDHLRFSTGINTVTGIVYLTLKALRHSGINNASEVYELRNETIAYNPSNDSYDGFVSFCPESYNILSLNNSAGCAFLTWQNSVPFIHPIIPEKYNNFYSIPCDYYIGITVNAKNKIIIPISCEEQSTAMFYVKRVTTDKESFLSEVPPIRVKQMQLNKWNFSFLSNVNSRGGLYGDEGVRGYFCNVLLIRDNSLALAYNEVDNVKREIYSETENFLIKFMQSSQSSYEENL